MHVTAMTSRDNINHRHCPYFIFPRHFVLFFTRQEIISIMSIHQDVTNQKGTCILLLECDI